MKSVENILRCFCGKRLVKFYNLYFKDNFFFWYFHSFISFFRSTQSVRSAHINSATRWKSDISNAAICSTNSNNYAHNDFDLNRPRDNFTSGKLIKFPLSYSLHVFTKKPNCEFLLFFHLNNLNGWKIDFCFVKACVEHLPLISRNLHSVSKIVRTFQCSNNFSQSRSEQFWNQMPFIFLNVFCF